MRNIAKARVRTSRVRIPRRVRKVEEDLWVCQLESMERRQFVCGFVVDIVRSMASGCVMAGRCGTIEVREDAGFERERVLGNPDGETGYRDAIECEVLLAVDVFLDQRGRPFLRLQMS